MTVTIDGFSLHCVRQPGSHASTRPPILGLHGGPGMDHAYVMRALRGLADAVPEIVAYDQLGSGLSDRPDAIPGGMAERADEPIQVAESLGLGPVVLFGHSWGGYVALETALRHPGKVLGLILANSGAAFDYPALVAQNAQARTTPEMFQVIMTALSQPMASDEAYLELYPQILPLYFHEPQAAYIDWMMQNTRFGAIPLNHGMGHCLPSWSAKGRLGALDAPTLIIAGEDDWIAPPSHAAGPLAAELPRATTAIIPRAGHFPFEEQPDAFLAAVRRWLDVTFPE